MEVLAVILCHVVYNLNIYIIGENQLFSQAIRISRAHTPPPATGYHTEVVQTQNASEVAESSTGL